MGPTAPRTGETGRDPGATGRSAGTAAAFPAIAIVLLAGLVLRLGIAYVLFPGSGFRTDINSFTAWAITLAHDGPGGFYGGAGFADYPPGYLWVLWLVGNVASLLAGPTGQDLGGLVGGLLKVPPILADLAVAFCLYRIARRWLGQRPNATGMALSAAALYLFNPVTWYDSALWGQVDAVGALVMLFAVVWLIDGHAELATAATAVAGLVKPQYGVVLVPVLAVVLLRRHLFRPGSGPVPAGGPAWLRAWAAREAGPRRLLTSALAGLAALLVLIVPFGLDPISLAQRLGGTAGGYPWLTVNAYNPWALLGLNGSPSLASAGTWTSDGLPLLGPLPAVWVGAGLLALGFLVGVIQLALRDDRRSILLTTAFLALAFFVLPTRVHERYLFPAFAFLPLLALGDRRLGFATAALAVFSFFNLHAILTIPLYATPNLVRLPYGELFRSYPFVAVSALGQTAVFGYLLWRLRPVVDLVVGPLRARLGLAPRAPDAPDVLPEPEPGPPPTATPAASIGAVGAASTAAPASPLEPSAAGVPAARSRLPRRLREVLQRRSLRRDRSAALADEPPGRLDRLDVVVVLLVFVAALTLRGWRVEEPYGMYFDEVYHARTATEFLQDWRYGEPHDIYEFTHPHLAKYLIATGLVLFGDDQVTGRAELGTPVAAAVVEPRWSPLNAPAERDGDRLYVAGGPAVHVYDLASRAAVVTLDVPAGAVGVALDRGAHLLYVADSAGGVWRYPTTALDSLRRGGGGPASVALARVGQFAGAPIDLAATDDGQQLVALLAGGRLQSLATASGGITGDATDPGAAALLPLAQGQAGRLAVADSQGVSFYDPATLASSERVALSAPATGIALVGSLDTPTLYVAAGQRLERVEVPATGSPRAAGSLAMPGAVRDVRWDQASNLVHVLGTAPDGAAATIYVVEPHANAVFADARLPFRPVAWALDQQKDYPSQDRQQLLALAADGQVAVVDAGQHAFGWRFMGVIFGALLAGLLYLMTRLLFRRRTVAVVMAVLVLADGMFFANARIAMNDIYAATFIVAAFTLFLALYLGRWRGWSATLLGLPAVGVLLGLALASKWVGAYAMGALVLLVLLRSALGRWLALAAMVVLTGLLGWLALAEPTSDTLSLTGGGANAPLGNLTFIVIMVALTALLGAAIVRRPIRWALDEVRLAVGGPIALGLLVGLAGALAAPGLPADGAFSAPSVVLAGAALVALGAVVFFALHLAGRFGFGPLAPAPGPGDPPATLEPAPPPAAGWLRPGALLGLPWAWGLLCLLALPLVVYVLSYIPWIALGNQWWAGFPADHHGQTFLDLQLSMYGYHNNLRATHAASSPWWAWPLDLKPVWWYQDAFANGTSGIIYDAGNLVAFWLAIPALAWCAWQGWRRRSLSLAFVVIVFLCLWLPWVRIDRATFQYHFFTAIPFSLLALAYFIAEQWHGPSPAAWALARLAGALAIVGVPLLWLLRAPLCWLAGVPLADPNSQACGYVSQPFVLTERVGVALLVLLVGAVAFVWQLRIAAADVAADEPPRQPVAGRLRAVRQLPGRVWLLVTAAATLAAMAIALGRFGDQPLISAAVGSAGPYVFALLVGIPLAIVARATLHVRDPRRWAIGAVGAAGLWFVVFYPDFASLPIPDGLKNLYQVLPLPTTNYAFQFATNTAAAPTGGVRVIGPESMLLILGVALLVGAVMYAARSGQLVPSASPAPDELPGPAQPPA